MADVSVRPALPADSWRIGEIHAATMLLAVEAGLHVPLDPGITGAFDADAFASQWERAITTPPSPLHRVLTALDRSTVVGFAAIAPVEEAVRTGPEGDPPEAEILALEVDPSHGRSGHGSRLLAACVDVLRQQNAGHVMTWAVQGDDPRARFLSSAGFAPLGMRRTWQVGDGTVSQIAWHAALVQGLDQALD
ncbi:MAG: N-acetyltransferase family protein [Actinomycetota bacterium]